MYVSIMYVFTNILQSHEMTESKLIVYKLSIRIKERTFM